MVICYFNFVIMIRYSKTVIVDYEVESSIVDQFPANEANITPWGTLRNDISALVAAQTEQEFNLILSRLVQMRSDDRFAGLTDDEILARIKPRFCQDPAEIKRFSEYVDSLNSDKLSKLKEKILSKKAKEFTGEPGSGEPGSGEPGSGEPGSGDPGSGK